jgi:RimJ/RimL family protein N-acetyltransferase
VNAIAAQPISSRRLTLVPLSPEDADEMAAVLADPDPEQELRARYKRWTAESPDPEVSWCNWVIQLRNPRCLTVKVQATISTADEPLAEVAWVVGTSWQGQGIATEAARALISWLGHQSVHFAIAHIHPRHWASATVAAATGLTPTAQLEDGETRWQMIMTP